jgi:RNA polymerase sigma-70 factor (ECF subfamily)
MNRLLACLPACDRRVLDLRFVRGLSIREIANQMHMTTGNTRVIQLRALRRVAELRAATPPSSP